MTNHESYYSMDNKLRVLHGQPWTGSSSSFYPHPPSSSVYSHNGDSELEYKHQINDINHGLHQDLEGTGILDFDFFFFSMIKSQMQLRPPVDTDRSVREQLVSTADALK